jgi:hypothetical protein
MAEAEHFASGARTSFFRHAAAAGQDERHVTFRRSPLPSGQGNLSAKPNAIDVREITFYSRELERAQDRRFHFAHVSADYESRLYKVLCSFSSSLIRSVGLGCRIAPSNDPKLGLEGGDIVENWPQVNCE